MKLDMKGSRQHCSRKIEVKSDVLFNSPLDHAIVFGMDMCGIITLQCVNSMQVQSTSDISLLDQFLPSIRIWLLWMQNRLDLLNMSSVRSMMDIWESYVALFNCLFQISTREVPECPDGKPVTLTEDNILSGFKPLSEHKQLWKIVSEENKELVESNSRIDSVKKLAFDISQTGKVPFTFKETTGFFETVIPVVVSPSPTKGSKGIVVDEEDLDFEDDDDDVIIEDVEENEEADSSSEHLENLKAKKIVLTEKIQEQEERRLERKAVIDQHSSQSHVISENSPSYLIVDTNCFVKYLPDVENILDAGDFTVVVPLVVVGELDGLKKGYLLSSSPQAHAQEVQVRASAAVDFLEDRFSGRHPKLKALTSKGTELDTIAFRNEEFSPDRGKNDDVILSCCLHFCEETVGRYSADQPVVIHRNVVLLTDDRNLRLKAHTRSVPTVGLPVFMKMAKFV